MAEYNFWDDRTYSCDDEDFCPVINDYCYHHNCDSCEVKKEFDATIGGKEHAEN